METESIQRELLPVRMLNEFAYCPRLFYLEHLEGRWEENAFTLEGKWTHRRIDKQDQLLPESEADDPEPKVARSVTLESPTLGLVAKLDLVETDGSRCIPVETKRGRVPENAERSYEPERIQLMAQGLLLREHGYQVESGYLYFQASRKRIEIVFTPELEAKCLEYLDAAQRLCMTREKPLPLQDSRKCNGCSLNGICLPDETLVLKALELETPDGPSSSSKDWTGIRLLYPQRDDALPLYIQEQGAYVGKEKDCLTISKSGENLGKVRLKDVSQVVLCGNISISAQTIHLLCESGVPIVHMSMGHWFYGVTAGFTLKNGFARAAQFKQAGDSKFCLALAKQWVWAKGQNQRTMLRRNADPTPDTTLEEMNRVLVEIETVASIESLLGYEGNLAKLYFSKFSSLLRPKEMENPDFDFSARNRRPPKDPINAMLSFGYSLLTKECSVALAGTGLDPFWGFYHAPRHGRPSLALDLMEEFRPLIVDSAVISAVNMGMVESNDFENGKNGCMLTAKGRKAFIRCFENRLDQLVTHPIFQYKVSWRRIIRVQAEFLCRCIMGEVAQYKGMVTR